MISVIVLSPSPPRRALAWVRSRLAVDRIVRRIDDLPRWAWPAFVAAAAWPSIAWAAQRLGDGSDDPLGIVALVALLVAVWCGRKRFDSSPRVGASVAAAGLMLIANAPVASMPDLLRALSSIAALVASLAAIAERDEPIAPYAGLALLALPLLSSLQFYAGFPLRVVTAEASRWLLMANGSDVEREGSALTVDGHLVLVDAPCSGVQMAWVAYFAACVACLLFRVGNRGFFARLPIVGATVLAGNIVRNTVLVAFEASARPLPPWLHDAAGLAVLTVVCGVVSLSFACAPREGRFDRLSHTLPRARPHRAHVLALVTIVVAGALGAFGRASAIPLVSTTVEWPVRLDGRVLRPLALSAVEARFAARFPGSIARFDDGLRTIVMRDVDRPTRRLHPAVDCYRGLGFAIAGEGLETDRQARLWRCFTASRGGQGLRVCERIVDADDHAFTDVSAWYWSSVLGRSRGPWRAVTVAMPITMSEGETS